MKKRKTSFWAGVKLFSFFLLAFFGVLALLEISARLLGYTPPKTVRGYQESKFVFHSRLLWELKPGWKGYEGKGEVKINSLGFRGDEIPSTKPPNEMRILCLGDSVTFGYWVKQDEPWPKVLEIIYQEHGVQATVINAGVPGYSTFQSLEQWRLKGKALNPDIVILGYCLNDATERYSTVASYGGKNVFLGVDTSQALPPLQRVIRSLALYRYISVKLQQNAKSEETYSVRRLFEEPLAPPLKDAWEKNAKEIILLKEDVTRQGKKFLVVVFPYFFQLLMKEEGEVHPKRILALCEQNHIECLDLLPLFRAHQEESLFLDGNHLNPAGHRLVAEAIFEILGGVGRGNFLERVPPSSHSKTVPQ